VVVDTVTSDLYKSAWEYVPGKSAQEFSTTESDVLFSRSLSVIFGNEGHFFISDIHDTLVSDGDPMSILPQVSHHMFGTCHRGLTMNHPGSAICTLNLIIEEHQLVLFAQGAFEAVQELGFKRTAHLMNRIKELPPMTDVFPSAIKGVAGSRDKTMDMRMK